MFKEVIFVVDITCISFERWSVMTLTCLYLMAAHDSGPKVSMEIRIKGPDGKTTLSSLFCSQRRLLTAILADVATVRFLGKTRNENLQKNAFRKQRVSTKRTGAMIVSNVYNTNLV